MSAAHPPIWLTRITPTQTITHYTSYYPQRLGAHIRHALFVGFDDPHPPSHGHTEYPLVEARLIHRLKKFVSDLRGGGLVYGSKDHPARPPAIDHLELNIDNPETGAKLTKALDGCNAAPGPSTFVVHTGHDEEFDFSVLHTLKSSWAPIPDGCDTINARGLQTLYISGMASTVEVINTRSVASTTTAATISPAPPSGVSWLEGIEALYLYYCFGLGFYFRESGRGRHSVEKKKNTKEWMGFRRLKEVTIIENDALSIFINLATDCLPKIERGQEDKATATALSPPTTTSLVDKPTPPEANIPPIRCLEVVRIKSTTRYGHFFPKLLKTLQTLDTIKHLELHLGEETLDEGETYYGPLGTPSDAPRYLPVSLEHLRIRGPPAMSAQLPTWIACAQDPTWLPNLKSIALRLDTGLHAGEKDWTFLWQRLVSGFGQGQKGVRGIDENQGMDLESDWAPDHPECEERKRFLEVLKRERPHVEIIEGWFRVSPHINT